MSLQRSIHPLHSPEAMKVQHPPLVDSFGRPLHDLRISVTDRCNLRCTYCMPREVFGKDFTFLPRTDLLSFEEISRLARLAVAMGVRKLRLSGGEPLLRHGLEALIEQLAALKTPEGQPVDIAMTTNGVLLERKAKALRAAGLNRLTVSLDGLTDATFQRMSDSQIPVSRILNGITAAQETGLAPIKVNMVVRRGINEHEIVPLAGHFRHSGIIVRFIEYMDVGSSNGWRLDEVVPASEVLARIHAEYPLRAVDPNYSGEVAKRWAYADGSGEIGVIASVTQAFCQTCTRLRLATDGRLYTCLFASSGIDLRAPLRSGADDAALSELIAGNWRERKDRYSALRHEATPVVGKRIEMSYIGG